MMEMFAYKWFLLIKGEIINRNSIYLLLVDIINRAGQVQACFKSNFRRLSISVVELYLMQRVTYTQNELNHYNFLAKYKKQSES